MRESVNYYVRAGDKYYLGREGACTINFAKVEIT